MIRLTGIFEEFDHVDEVDLNKIKYEFKFSTESNGMENYIANRCLYPQTVAMNQKEVVIDLAIIKSIVSQHPQLLYNPKTSTVEIPGYFITRLGSVSDIIMALIDVLPLQGNVTVLVNYKDKDFFPNKKKVEGTIVAPVFTSNKNIIDVYLNQAKYSLEPGMVHRISNTERHVELHIEKVMDLSIAGGELGVVLDLRRVMTRKG